MAELKIRQIECANCGAKIDIRCGLRSKTFACDYCGAVCQNNQVVSLQQQHGLKERFAPRSFLKLGMKGQFLGRTYQIVGRIRLSGRDLHDVLDVWDWDEWFMISETGFPLWLQEDENGYTLFRPYIADRYIDPYEISDRYFIENESFTVEESDYATVEYIEGELTWKSRPAETFSYVDLRKGIERFSIEYNSKEIQYLKGKVLKKQELEEAFGLKIQDKTIDKKISESEKKPISWKTVLALMGIFGAIALLGGYFFLKDSGDLALEHTAVVRVKRLGETEFIFTDVSGKPVTFTLKKGPLITVRFDSGNFPYGRYGSSLNREAGWWLTAELYEKGPNGLDKHIRTINTDFWRAEGVDEGESWSESSLVDRTYLKGLKKGKEYYFKFAVGANQNMDKYYDNNIKLRMQIREGSWYPSPLLYYGWIVIIFPAFFLILFLIQNYSGDDD